MLLSALLRRGCLIKYRNKPIDLIAFNLYMRVFVAIDQGIHHTHARVCAYIFFFHQAAVRKMYVLCNQMNSKLKIFAFSVYAASIGCMCKNSLLFICGLCMIFALLIARCTLCVLCFDFIAIIHFAVSLK